MSTQNPIDLSKVIKPLDKIEPKGCVVLGFQAQLGKFQGVSEISHEADDTVWLSRSPQGAIDQVKGFSANSDSDLATQITDGKFSAVCVSTTRCATEADILKAGKALNVRVHEERPLDALRGNERMLRALKAKGFDSAAGRRSVSGFSPSGLPIDPSQTHTVDCIVAFDIHQIRLLRGVQRKVMLTMCEYEESQVASVDREGAVLNSAHELMHTHAKLAMHRKTPYSPADFKADLMHAKTIDKSFDININAVSAAQHFPISAAACSLEYLIVLESVNANFKLKTAGLETALHLANSPESIDFLLSKGIDINAVTKTGKTPLHYRMSNATEPNSIAIAEHLIKRGADVNANDLDGRTALHCIARLYSASPEGIYKPFIQMLVKAGANIDAPSIGELSTPLHDAATRENLSAMIDLAICGANLNAENARGLRPLHIAIQRDGSSTDSAVHALVALGASTHGVACAKSKIDKELQEPTLWDPLESTCRHASLSIL